MFYVEKKLEISASHRLDLSYKSKCDNLHGHNWSIIVCCKGEELNKDGMVIDFTLIKSKIYGYLDHKNLNDCFLFNPTAENIAYWVVSQIDTCYKAVVIESSGNKATYEEGGT